MPKTSWILSASMLAAGWFPVAAATPVYHLDFRQGEMKNSGTAGGEAAPGGAASRIGAEKDPDLKTFALQLPMDPGGRKGPSVVLPESGPRFHLDGKDDSMSVALWVKWNGPNGHPDGRHGIASKMPGTQDRGWAFSILNDGRLQFNWRTEKGGSFRSSKDSIPEGEWTHVVLTWMNSGTSKNLRFFINGQIAGINEEYTGGGPLVFGDEEIRMGVIGSENDLPVNGSIAEVSLFEVPLEVSEIEVLATRPAPDAARN